MRRLTAFILILSLVFIFTGCVDQNPTDDDCGTECLGGDHEFCPDPDLTLGTRAPNETNTPPLPKREEVDFPGYDPTEHEMRDITSHELIKEIKTGWNLGNTFDAPSETAWHNPHTTYTMLYAVKEAGFDSIRLPVSWENHTGSAPDYTIKEEYLDRIEQIVQYVLALDMYCILNTHHEHWLFPTEEKFEQNAEQLSKMWLQLSERFADYNEKLIFESMNEPRLFGTPDEWNGGTQEAQDIVNRLNDVFIETIRGEGGNHAKRHLMIPSYAASADFGAMAALSEAFPIHDDKVIASIHAYVPHDFALKVDGIPFWKEKTHEASIDRLFDHITTLFIEKDIPIILGETGAMIKDRDKVQREPTGVEDFNLEDRVEWARYYFSKSREHGIPAYWWDNGLFVQNSEGTSELFGLLDRRQGQFVFPEIIDAIMDN